MSYVVKTLSGNQMRDYQDQFIVIYRDAFSPPPYRKGEDEVAEFAQSLPYYIEKEDFRLVVAVSDKTGEAVGFAYGYRPSPEQLWYTEVVKLVQPHLVTAWLANSFQLVEIAVTPTVQGKGVGGQLHDQLLGTLNYQRAVLVTMAAETNAYMMYRKRGWVVLLDKIIFPGIARPYRIMRLNLRELAAVAEKSP